MSMFRCKSLAIGSIALRGVLLLLILALVSPASALHAAPQAQIPSTFNYQGTLRDAQGNLVTGTRDMTFRIYDDVLAGSKLHEEAVSGVSVRDGIFNVVLGNVVAIAPTVFASGPRFIGITVSPDPNEMVPRQRLHPVPWAQLATNALTANSATNAANATNATSANTATTLVPNATIDGLVIDKGATNAPALRLTSSGPGFGSGIYLQNTGPGNKTFAIYTTPSGFFHLNDVSRGRDAFFVDQNGVMTIRESLVVDNNISVGNSITANGKITADQGFNGRCGPNNTNPVICNSDVAETFGTDERIDAGNLVVFIPEDREVPAVRRSTEPYEGALVGVVSTDPGLVFDQGETRLSGDNRNLITDHKTVVAMVGRVPTKFSLENGPIAVGDPLTSSSTPGAAMKATQAGQIIGYAMQSSDAATDGKLLVWLQLGMYIPGETLAAINGTSDATIAHLEAQVAALTTKVAALDAANNGARWPWGLPLFGGLLLVGAVVGTRKRLQGAL
ncbi:MAG: hypothetical protein R2932_26645 [Caldilineaceae bacterium]